MVEDGVKQLPDGWEWKSIGDIAKLRGGFSFKSNDYQSDGVLLIRQSNLNGEKVNTDNPIFLPEEYLQTYSKYVIRKGDVLIGMSGSIGKLCVYNLDVPALQNQRTGLFEFYDERSKPYVRYYLESLVDYFLLQSKGVAVQNISFSEINSAPIPIPPFTEQERIVTRIEELFSDLDAGVTALERVRAGLRRYKASVLKAAVEGKLVGADGIRPLDEGAQVGRTPSARMKELPEGWRWTTVDELAAKERNSITDGPFGSKLKTEHYKENGPRVIRLQNIGDGEFRDEKAHISREHFETLRKHQVFAGDLVIAGLGESLPRACMIPEFVGDAIVKADCIRFKPNQELADNKYLLYALNSDPVKKLVAKVVHGIGRPRMNQQEIKAIPIPLPPLDEQRRIVAEVERRLSVVGEVESAVEMGLVRAAKLRQSILRHAFEGKLS